MTTQRGSAGGRPIAVAIAAGAAGAALALGALWAAGQMQSQANAQDPPSAGGNPVTLSVAQLRINQRISQAAVRRSNESLSLLGPLRGTGVKGWRTEDLRDDAVTGPKLADASVGNANLATEVAERLPLWAVVNAGGGIVRQRGATNAQSFGTGAYRVTFQRDVSQCSYTASQNQIAAGDAPVVADPANAQAVLVVTTNAANPHVAANRSFSVQVLC